MRDKVNRKLPCKLSECRTNSHGWLSEKRMCQEGRKKCKFLEEAELALFRSRIRGVRGGNEGVRSGSRVRE